MKKKVKYVKKDPISHILDRSEMYVGSVRNKIMEEYIATQNDENNFYIHKENINMNPGLLRIFVEALSNAVDNVKRSNEEGNTKCTKICVSLNKETGETSVWNDGEIVAIEKNEETNEYNHSMIFGQLLTSSNYNDEDERLVSGKFGLGIKLCNVYSREFKVSGLDPENKKIFEQVWTNNMKETEGPKIKRTTKSKGYTKVSWIPDFRRFNLTGYTEDIINLYRRYVFDAAMLTKVKVYFNDILLPVKDILSYSKFYLKPDNTEILKIKDGEIVITSSNGNFEAISFVNGVYTAKGGIHVDSWSESIFRPIVNKFNKPKKPQINISDIKKYFRIFVNISIPNPEFDSQSKMELTGPPINTKNISNRLVSTIMRWNFVEKIEELIRSKELIALKKKEKKVRGFKKIEGLDPANNAGGKLSSKCTLILTEGLSAKTYAVTGIQKDWNGYSGRDFNGIYPLRGKVLNVRNASTSSIANNKEITGIIQALGVRYGVDYTKEENFKTLNYGRVMILADADDDGIHIKSLILNFIHSLFPSLLKRETPFIISMQTPIVRIFLKSKNLIFYDEFKYQQYVKNNPDKKLKVKYYKGLGTSSNEEVLETFGERIVELKEDDLTEENMNKAFHKSYSDARKDWLAEYKPGVINTIGNEETPILQVNISDFIDGELIKFSISDCARSIPNIMDGFKESHRKILYACFLKNLSYNSKTLKVAQLSGFVAEKTNYHHGEQNLYDTITKMAHDFPGSNNIPLLYRDGAFGSRLNGGRDAANARYIFTKLDELTRLIFRPEDDCLLERNIDDGDEVEPKYYVPIIPMILVNGCSTGIGTGWSSSIPCYNPLELIECIYIWLKNNTIYEDEEETISILPELTPWYRGFQGDIERNGTKYTTYGKITNINNNKISIDELPIGVWTDKFKETLEEYVENKMIKNIKNYSTPKKVKFILTESKDGFKCNLNNLKLYSHLHTSNMVLFTEEEQLHKFNSVDEIIDMFCKVRYKFYIKRKQYILKHLKYYLTVLQNKARFLRSVINKELVIFEKDEKIIIEEMVLMEYIKINDSFDYLLKLPVRSFTLQNIENLNSEILKIENKILNIQNTTEKKMWKNDLKELEIKYNKWLKNEKTNKRK